MSAAARVIALTPTPISVWWVGFSLICDPTTRMAHAKYTIEYPMNIQEFCKIKNDENLLIKA